MKLLCFNDDIQGTAATVLAGLYGALKIKGLQCHDLANERFLVCGAGSAGSGAIKIITNTLVSRYGMEYREACEKFYVFDKDGLITKCR